ncbi:MAG: hypothetical protein M1829_004524 [Trizodia sp. TS-e1964]|nr:MAG: hypothetical protein M1829_004524 [Trizodia sp. TS-e1964]
MPVRTELGSILLPTYGNRALSALTNGPSPRGPYPSANQDHSQNTPQVIIKAEQLDVGSQTQLRQQAQGPRPSTAVKADQADQKTQSQSRAQRQSPGYPWPAQATTMDGFQLRKPSTSQSNAIVPSLQIPSSINDSKGSLAEFAAQITCLLWFESSTTLLQVEESKCGLKPSNPLVAEAIPSMGFRKWVTTILSTTQVTQNVILLALLFIYRLKNLNPAVKGKSGSEFRLLTVALMLGNKFLDDNTYTNKTWAEVSGISVQEVHIMEVEFLSNMRYSLFTSEAEWKEWHVKLGRFWSYFEQASRMLAEAPLPKPVVPVTPTLYTPPALPSPPNSTQASSPYVSSYSPVGPSFPHPLSMPPLPPAAAVMLPQTVDRDSRMNGRKRSYDHASQEPPAKRMTRSATQAASLSASSLNPIYTPAVIPPPRLPVPNLTISCSQANGYGMNHAANPAAHLPPIGGRSMSMIFPGPMNYPQSSLVASSLTPSLTPTHNSNPPLYPESNQSRRQSPFHSISTSSSPTSATFSSYVHNHNHSSPSYFLSNRNSPYRPVRGVQQLLVPPPQASMNGAAPSLAYDQMHYQPLGKPNERRTGVVPFMPTDNWSNFQPNQPWISLPQPNFHA